MIGFFVCFIQYDELLGKGAFKTVYDFPLYQLQCFCILFIFYFVYLFMDFSYLFGSLITLL
jgi:hypothetical protein